MGTARRPVSAYSVARIYAALDDRTRATRWLERGYADHASEMFALKLDPVLDPLRSDARFTQLMSRIRLD